MGAQGQGGPVPLGCSCCVMGAVKAQLHNPQLDYEAHIEAPPLF